MFGFQRRRVLTCEWETLFPKLGPLPQISHTDATAVLLTDSFNSKVLSQSMSDSQGGKPTQKGPVSEIPFG